MKMDSQFYHIEYSGRAQRTQPESQLRSDLVLGRLLPVTTTPLPDSADHYSHQYIFALY